MIKNGKKRNIRITPRDDRLIRYLFENKISTIKKINRDVFGGTSLQNHYGRLLSLKQLGLISIGAVAIGSQNLRTYSLTQKGLNRFAEISGLEIIRGQITSDSKSHDLALVDILYRFRKMKNVQNVIGENMLLSVQDFKDSETYGAFSELESDAYLLMDDNKIKLNVAVEYERTLKSVKRTAEKMFDYFLRSEVDMVIYIAETENYLKRLVKMDRQIHTDRKSKMYFCLISDVLSSESDLLIRDSNGNQKVLT